MNVRPGKNQIQQQPPQQQPQPNYNPRSNAPQQYNLHPYDHQDGPQKFAYGSPYVSGAGAGQPPRMPLVTGIPGSTQSLPGTPNASLGGMPQGPPPTTYVSHGPVDLSKQTPPHHQGQHHPLPPGSLGVNQQIMANPGHAGPMQGRQAQGNNQYFQRNPNIRPGSQPMRPPMHGGGASMNASHPPNAQAMPYPTQSQIINQPLLFVLNDQYNNQTQMYSYTNPANYYQPGNMVPPGSVQYQAQPRASTPTPYGYRPAGSYQYQMQASQTVYFPQQPQQPQQQQQAQQIQQQQPQQQAQQQPQQQIVSSAVTTPQSAQSQPQPRESGSSSSGRKTRSSALRIVDPDTHCDVLTGEKVAPSEAATPTTTQPPDLPSTPGSTPLYVTPAVTPVTVQVPATTSTATPPAVASPAATTTAAIAKITPETVGAPKEDSPAPVAPDAATAIVIESTPTTVPVAAPVSQEAIKITESKPKTFESTPSVTGKTDTVIAPPVPVSVVAATAATVVTPAPKAASAQENGVVAKDASVTATATSELSSTTSPTPVSTSTSPEAGEGRGTQKGGSKKRKSSNSRTGSSTPTSPPPPLVQAATASVAATSAVSPPAVEQPVITVAPPTQSKPEADSSVPAAKMEASIVKEMTLQPSESLLAAPTPIVIVDKKTVVEKPATFEVPVQSVITNGDQTSSPSSSVIESSVTTPTAVEEGSGGKSSSLRYSKDQWSPANPEGKKTYDRNFLLELMNNPASQKKPDGLPNLEVVRDKQSALASVRRGVSVGDFTPGFIKPMPVKGMVKRPSQQGQRGDQGSGMSGQIQRDGPPQRREIKLPSSSLVRVERIEDPNVWKPKHAAVKPKEEDPDKSSLEEMSKAVRGILNKLTPSKFDKLLVRIQALNIDTEERLAEVIRLFFEKAVDEPIFSPTYAKMCHALSTKEVASSSNPSETTNFRKLLLTRCQREFEKDSAGLVEVENKRKEIEENEAEDKKKVLEEELEDLINKNRRRSLGNIRFIGELFKLRILSAKIMHQCILRLLSQPEDEESLECLCRLLSTIGKELESPAVQTGTARSASSSSRETMNSYFSTLDSIVQKRKVSNRIRFMIQDVVDLRKCQWKPRREDNKPQTIEQVHQDALREREQQERELNNPQFQGSMGGGGGQMRDNRGGGDRRGDRGDDRNRKQSRPNDDGWNTVSNNSRSNAKLDMSKLRIPKAASGDADQGISLGPGGRGMGAWGRGASGGMQSQSMIGGTSTGGGTGQDSRTNRYQLLEDDHGSSHLPSEASKAPFSGRSSLGGPPAQGNRGNQDYRNMPGSTKSAFFPPKDTGERPERASFDSARQPNLGPGGRSRSQQSSRENSVTRPVRDAAQSPLLREPSKEMLLGKSTSSEDEIERKAHSLLGEFFINERIEDTVLDMKEWLHPATVSKFINQCLMHAIELKRKERRGTGTLLKEMIKRQLFTSNDILEGFAEVLQSAEDFVVDIPKLWEYLAEMVEPLFEDGAMTFGFLGPLSSSLGSSLAPPFVAAVLKELVIAQGTAGAERIWGMSNTTLAIVLPGVDDKAFVSQHKGLEFVLNVESTSRSTVSGGKPNSGNASASTSMYIDFQHKLEKFLRGSQPSIEDVCAWIKNQRMVEDNPAFIRALTTAVTESAIDGYGTESKLNSETLKKWTEVLRRYVENIADRELQLLFAVQTLVTQRQHPKGLIQGIFETLYDCNVVSEEGFTSWTTSDDPSEREGKAVALKSITSFLTWLNEAEAESDQEVDG